ncbi:agmatinase family protein [Flavobacterium sp.]|uniref:agmatinase family protein n=1 Tax=Flavobacterium sp. TaxID=239 RepID=UPI0035282D80
MKTKEEILKNFDPNQPGLEDATIFGLPFTAEQSEIIVIPVPWEVTVSYGSGASKGPKAILEASYQIDLLHQEYPDLWKAGIYMEQIPSKLKSQSKRYKKVVAPIIKALEKGKVIGENTSLHASLTKVNVACEQMVEYVKEQTLYWQNQGKHVVLVGGDHSTPLGYYQALATKHNDFGILHLDAHMDLRIAYEGFTYSHASIMYNALQIKNISKIVQVGIRDFCEQEVNVVKNSKNRVKVFTDLDLKKDTFEGKTWQQQCNEIIEQLPQKVCISFDIDGLYPWYCPNTGTPVPGGFSFEQATYLFAKLAESKKEIIGFDLVEVAPDKNSDWDGNVGARMLFAMCGAFMKSQKKIKSNKIVFN